MEISKIEMEIDQLYEGFGEPYQLVAAFMHDGAANFGHYVHYCFDNERSRWIKYNDSIISVVPESEVFADTSGKSYNAIILCYAEEAKLPTFLKVLYRIGEKG